MSSEEEKLSPVHDSYAAATPDAYMAVGDLNYDPKAPVIPAYCNVLVDVAALFGNTSLASMYGWSFKRTCEFWKAKKPLTDEEREKTLINKRIKVIGIDGAPLALQYAKGMNILDEIIAQDFTKPMLAETEAALAIGDVWTMQCCISYMPIENITKWIEVFMRDRSRPKRIVYDFNPYFDDRELTPDKLFGQYPNWTAEPAVHYAYRDKSEEEYEKSKETGRGMKVYHYTVDFSVVG